MTAKKWIVSVLVFSLCLPTWSGVIPHAHGEETGATEEHNHEGETVWICSMHPQIQLPEPGQCPICFMDLIEVPKTADGGKNNLRQISFDERARRLAQVEVVPVVRGTVNSRVRMVGKVVYDETRLGVITAWMNGRIDKLFVDYTGSKVQSGQPMAEIYSPELLTAQAELIQAAATLDKLESSAGVMVRSAARRTESAAREKLRLLGLTEEQVNKVVERGKPDDHVTLIAPLSGVVIKKDVNTGMYVKTGNPIFTIADLAELWVVLEAYESDLHAIRLNQQVEFTVEAFPGRVFTGEVVYIDPLVNDRTRTVGVRLNVDNSDGTLKPGMFVRATARSSTGGKGEGEPLLIPDTAPLFTGKRALVYVQTPDKPGEYTGREVVLGARRGLHYQVKSGLKEGELVVIHGNFKIDSAIQIQARPSMMNPFLGGETPEKDQVQSLFISKLGFLNKAFITLDKYHRNRNRTELMAAVESFGSLLKEMNPDDLEGDVRLSWKELAMLLSSDVILIRDAEGEKDLDRMVAEMKTHFKQVRDLFQLSEQTTDKPGSEKLKNLLGALLDAYIDLQESLAGDNLEKSLENKKKIQTAVVDAASELKGSGIEGSVELADELETSASGLSAPSTMEEIRAAFFPLSQAMTRAVSNFGVNSKGPVYEQYCPMAFDNTGATWLAATKEINNPYFGDMMLRCGEIRRQLKDK